MEGDKIGQLNFAIRESIPAMQDVAKDNVGAEMLLRAVTFSSGAQWHVAQATPVDQFSWTDVTAAGVTDLGHALRLVTEQLKIPPMSSRALQPVLVLISDGYPTDDYQGPLKQLLDEPWGKKAVRLAIAVGDDADLDVLQRFIGHPEIKPMVAKNSATLVKFIRWASTAVVKSVSQPVSRPTGRQDDQPQVPVPAPPPPHGDPDVW
ncbi:hypothetical protein Aab01nite_31810 [Paractinoplanes abujensis]|uniref:Uncharacterized protein YegL n=2 Tax=Paractinoplanes abujensis TaxID=882441 RepID=A0A7W7G6E0_9ACTN|nr:uncharacterized protein YegL [Actinoplanes abujensis]GID19591.1 hypothetical protein Aab01nite_31810 [Actinoplanes abujensis]